MYSSTRMILLHCQSAAAQAVQIRGMQLHLNALVVWIIPAATHYN